MKQLIALLVTSAPMAASWQLGIAKPPQKLEIPPYPTYLHTDDFHPEWVKVQGAGIEVRTSYLSKRSPYLPATVTLTPLVVFTKGATPKVDYLLWFLYEADDWLFINAVSFLVEGKVTDFPVEPQTDVVDGGITEMFGLDDFGDWFSRADSSFTCKVRLTGRSGAYVDFVLGPPNDYSRGWNSSIQEFLRRAHEVQDSLITLDKTK
ncbi:hypothetical protein KKH27_02285 [bacterium]|nr:hypothetical protein [bacterium]MBU1983970.1 hypothetical protein [bacterium]